MDNLVATPHIGGSTEEAQEIVGVLTALKNLSDHGTDSSGKPTDHFKVTLDAQGNTLVNGKPFNPAGP